MPTRPSQTAESVGEDFLVELTHIYRDAMKVIEQKTGMSQSRLEIMHELSHAPELSQASLQQHLGVEGAVITRIVKQLEQQGLVTRRADPNDNRFTLVSLSPYGKEMSAKSENKKFHKEYAAGLMKDLTQAERTQLLKLMQKVRANAREARGGSPYDAGITWADQED